jgi:hypothetical protein
MPQTELPVTPEALCEHARTTARADEIRHAARGEGTLALHQERTYRGWGSAAFEELVLTWRVPGKASPAQRATYIDAYTLAYRQARTERLARRAL